MRDSSQQRGGWVAPLAAMAGLVTAASCCLPIGYVIAAAGMAGAGTALAAARPYLFGASVLLLVSAFARAYWGRQCRPRRSAPSLILLWTSAALAVLLLLFPQWIAGLAADWLGPEARR